METQGRTRREAHQDEGLLFGQTNKFNYNSSNKNKATAT